MISLNSSLFSKTWSCSNSHKAHILKLKINKNNLNITFLKRFLPLKKNQPNNNCFNKIYFHLIFIYKMKMEMYLIQTRLMNKCFLMILDWRRKRKNNEVVKVLNNHNKKKIKFNCPNNRRSLFKKEKWWGWMINKKLN